MDTEQYAVDSIDISYMELHIRLHNKGQDGMICENALGMKIG